MIEQYELLPNLTDGEAAQLAHCEAVIEAGLRTFYDVGSALLTIRDARLYRQGYGTFEDYLQERWGLKRQRAYELMDAANVARNLSEISDMPVQRESHAAALSSLSLQDQHEVWRRVVEMTPPGEITAARIEQVAEATLYPNTWRCPRCGARWGIDAQDCANCRDVLSPARLPEQPNGHNPTMAVMTSSASPEWYTPDGIIGKVLEMWGTIDLDPCSNSHEAPNVPAATHYTKEDNGLSRPWIGRVYMNPPYGDEIPEWVTRLMIAAKEGEIDEAIALLPARTDTIWFRPLWEFPCCFIHGRLRFRNSENSAPFPSVVVYIGDNGRRFVEVFGAIGTIVRKWPT